MYKRIKITFHNGDVTVVEEGKWDDYAIYGDFIVIKKKGAWVALYSAKEVFSLVLEK